MLISRLERKLCSSRYRQRVQFAESESQMHLQNLVQGRLVNGSIGKVTGFRSVANATELHTEIAEVDDRKVQPHSSSPQELQKKLEGRLWPLVRFANERAVLCVPTEFQQVNALGIVEASRDQVRFVLIILF